MLFKLKLSAKKSPVSGANQNYCHEKVFMVGISKKSVLLLLSSWLTVLLSISSAYLSISSVTLLSLFSNYNSILQPGEAV